MAHRATSGESKAVRGSSSKSATVPRKPATVSDVAALAGVSVGTVSNVLNGRATVTDARRKRVLQAIEQLGFSGSVLAKGMRQQRYPLIGLCVPHTTFSNFAALADVLEESATNSDFELVQMISRHDPKLELARINSLLSYRASGVIMVPSVQPEPTLDRLYSAGIPTVLLNRLVPEDRRFDQVSVDHRSALQMAAEQLIDWGHPHLMIAIQHPTLSVTQQRIKGLEAAARAGGRGTQYSVLECGFDELAFQKKLAKQAGGKDRPSVIIASNSGIAAWLILAFRALGWRCPEDVSLLVLEEPEWAALANPQISCIQQPTREIARIAWSRLKDRIAGTADDPVTIRCDAKIVFRESVMRR